MRKTIVLCLIVSASFVAPAGELVIAERGKPAEYAVVIAEKASPSEKWAAGDFRKYVEKLTGVKLAVRTDAEALPERAVVMGWTKYTGELLGKDSDATLADLDECGFILKAVGKRLVAAAGPVSGTVYASDELLERFGRVRWLTPWFERVPEAARFAVPDDLDFTDRPKLSERTSYIQQFNYNPSFCAHRRINGSNCGDACGQTRYRYGSKFGACHTFDYLLPEEKYFKRKPEMYALSHGSRTAKQPCLTNPETLETVVVSILDYLDREPNVRMVGVSQNDTDGWCECERCKAVYAEEGAPSGTLVRFLNKVATRVRAKHPNVLIQTLAYQYTETPPKKTRFVPGIVVTYCGTGIGHAQPLAESVFPPSQKFAENYRTWGAMGAKVDTWTYDMNIDWFFWPFPNLKSARKNFQFYAENGGRRVMQQTGFMMGDSKQLQLYCYSKWMWNPYLDFWPTVDEFIDGYYGAKAAPIVKEYYRYVYDHHAKRDVVRFPMRQGGNMSPELFGEDFVRRSDDFWGRIFAATEDESEAIKFNTLTEGAAIAFVHLKRFTERYPLMALRQPKANAEFSEAAALARRLAGLYTETLRRNLFTANTINPRRWVFFGDCPLLGPDFDHVLSALEHDEIPSPSYERVVARRNDLRPFRVLDGHGEYYQGNDPQLPGYQLGTLRMDGAATGPVFEANLDRILADEGQEICLEGRMKIVDPVGGAAMKFEVVDAKSGAVVASRVLEARELTSIYTWVRMVGFKWRKGLLFRMGGVPGAKKACAGIHIESWRVFDPSVRQAPFFETRTDSETMLVTNVAIVCNGERTDITKPGARLGEISFLRDGRRVVLKESVSRILDAEEWRWNWVEPGLKHTGRTNNIHGQLWQIVQFNLKSGKPEKWTDIRVSMPFTDEGRKRVKLVVDETENCQPSDFVLEDGCLRFRDIDWSQTKDPKGWVSVRYHFEVDEGKR